MNPFEFSEPIATERLTLRLMTHDDTDAVHAWMSDPEVVRYQLYEPRDREVVAEKVAEMAAQSTLADRDDWIQPGVELAGHGIIGSIYFKLASLDDETGEIGWAFTRAYQGKGYAAEAASAMLDLAFGPLGLHRVYAELDPRNDASVALCLRLGMRHEAHFVEHMMFKGAWADTGMYGILDREWRAR
ncbi:MAG: N-acetyltransferase [Rhodoglobus sp.]|nr:N-acetyltransferase [Rhodoglobus sp.]